jgi:predicted nucleic acid-binding protein
MIVVDTNVLSALTRPAPDQTVLTWLDAQPRSSIWTTSVTLFELRVGIATMPDGRRRATLEAIADRIIGEIIEFRILPFDAPAAEASAALTAVRRQRGRPGELRDTMIAGIAIARRATLATRNIRHFADLPVAVINPWAD